MFENQVVFNHQFRVNITGISHFVVIPVVTAILVRIICWKTTDCICRLSRKLLTFADFHAVPFQASSQLQFVSNRFLSPSWILFITATVFFKIIILLWRDSNTTLLAATRLCRLNYSLQKKSKNGKKTQQIATT